MGRVPGKWYTTTRKGRVRTENNWVLPTKETVIVANGRLKNQKEKL